MLVFLHTLWRKTLNSVLFGIMLMVLVGAYIAIGSGRPTVREYFEMNELQFLSAWPLKLLMGLLVINLATVTFTRIPFTPPRYGVWMIHAGIITLIAGMSFYYNRKVEGLTRLYTDPRLGSGTVDYYYDSFERSLFVRRGDGPLWTLCRLPALPRFTNHEMLDDRRLKDLKPVLLESKGFGQPPSERPMFDSEVRIDITGYWPYANISTKYYPDATQKGGVPGIHLSLSDQPASGAGDAEAWLISSDFRNNAIPIENNELQHLHMPEASAIETLKQAATQIHKITARVGGHEVPLAVEVGKTYPVGESGYTLTIESYNPAWPMSGTGEIVKALTMMVKSPAGGAFRRMILDGKELQTDFKLDDPSGGPMGKRQKEPLDNDLVLLYHFSDPFRLLPRQGSVKHLIVTASDNKGIAIISTGLSQGPQFKEIPSGVGEFELAAAEVNAPFLKAMGQLPKSADQPPIKLKLERNDHMLRDDSVDVVPPAKRDRNFGESGAFQVVRAHVKVGEWSQDVLVPYSMDAAEAMDNWDGGAVELPGGTHLQLQLGNTRLQLPATLTLRKFDMVPYPGGDTGDMIRDFRSTVTVHDPASGEEFTAVAHMNNPIYFGNGAWLFFQAQFDPKSRWTVLGVGNRPGVFLMIVGCLLMVVGLMYAFYLKPVIIKRMKEAALAEAAAKKAAAKKPHEELVGSK